MPFSSNYSGFLSLVIEQEAPNHPNTVEHWCPPTLISGGSSEHPRYQCPEEFCSAGLLELMLGERCCRILMLVWEGYTHPLYRSDEMKLHTSKLSFISRS